jgi:hypothetical protein
MDYDNPFTFSLPDVAGGLQDSMKEVNAQTGMEIQKMFEFRTALPEAGSHPDEIVALEHLYFIQLLPNELPSTTFGRQKMCQTAGVH